MTRRDSALTVTDIFCGAGGNTIGAKKAGLTVKVGLNHWERAIETYGRNNPEVDQIERVDVSLCDPRRYHRTDIAIMSPECTTHSPAGGSKHRGSHQPDLFNKTIDASTMRSRVTMFDVVRFTEYHRYDVVICENVVEVTRWELFEQWLGMMVALRYKYRILSLNSQFFWPTPQSRDRVYLVFWKEGNPAPDLDFRPLAPCPVHGHVNAIQAWKNGRTIGKYKQQYVYTCPRCRRDVRPFYFAALNAIDFTLPAERIGDRRVALKPRTMERIEYGLKKYGHRQLIVQTNMTSRLASQVRSAEGEAMPTQPASVHHAVVSPPTFAEWLKDTKAFGGTREEYDRLYTSAADYEAKYGAVELPPNFLINTRQPSGVSHRVRSVADVANTVSASGDDHALVTLPGFLIETAQTSGERRKPRDLSEASPTMGAQQTSALVMPYIIARRGGFSDAAAATGPLPGITTAEGQHAVVQGAPFIMSAGSRDSDAAADAPMPAQTASERLGVVNPLLVTLRTHAHADEITDPLRTAAAAGNHHALIQGAALMSLRDANAMHVGDFSEPTMTQAAAPQSALIATTHLPFLTSYYGQDQASALDAPVGTMTGIDRHGLVAPESIRVEDCYFRMLQPHEIGAAMAFPVDYEVGGNKRDRVKQYGNAVTPPVMDWIVRQCAATLAPEIAEVVA